MYGGRPRVPAGASESVRQAVQQFPRQALHATRLGLHHPVSGDYLQWQVTVPADMAALLDALRSELVV